METDSDKKGFRVFRDGEVLCLESSGQVPPLRISVDFCNADFGWRRRQPASAELVVKAVGGSRSQHRKVVDATAGLGQDGFILALAGFQVRMIERSAIVHALLQDGLQRAQRSNDLQLAQAASRIELLHGSSDALLPDMDDADIIYLDPMFPARRKSAKVKKNMQMLQALLHGDEEDAAQTNEAASAQLLETALQRARHRVVVKRPRIAGHLGGHKPSSEIAGKTNRFDIYLCHS